MERFLLAWHVSNRQAVSPHIQIPNIIRIMTAFDPQLLGQLYATPKFQRDFGYEYKGQYIIKASWQTGLLMGSPIGQVVGAFFAAYPMEWYG